MDLWHVGVDVLLPFGCLGVVISVVAYSYVRYRRSVASGVSPQDVSSTGRRSASWSSRLRNSFSRNSPVNEELPAVSEKEEEVKEELGEDVSGEIREVELIITPKARISYLGNESFRGSPIADEAGQGSQQLEVSVGSRQGIAEEEGVAEDTPMQFSPPVSGNVSGLYFDAVTLSSYAPNSGLTSPEYTRNPPAPVSISPLHSAIPVTSPVEEPPDLETGLDRPKSRWKWSQLWSRNSSSNGAGSSGGPGSSNSGFAAAIPFTPGMTVDRKLTRVYTSRELNKASNNFSKRNEIGLGGFGRVYKGSMNNHYIAIKKLSSGSNQGVKEFVSEVKITGRMAGLRHPNLVPLLGWCQDKKELMLVYAYYPAGSLDRILHSRISPVASNPLTWEKRYKIISDIAAALAFLHSGWAHCVVHRDVKTSNILLDGDRACLGDFGLARQHNFGFPPLTTTDVGTPGYFAPEIALGLAQRHLTDKLDVYSFGVVTLEIASGRRPIDHTLQHPLLVDWVWDLHEQDRLLEAADPRMAGQWDSGQLLLVLQLGLLCSHLNPRVRCKMTDVGKYLQMQMVPPALPPVRPRLAYA